GLLVIIDGLDGIGKGQILSTFESWAIDRDKKVYNLEHLKNSFLPTYAEMKHYDVIISAEPTNVGIGEAIRKEIILAPELRPHSYHYTSKETAQLFAFDRQILYQRIIIPAFRDNK
ncbi:MAG: hypothetical protein ACK4NX_03165, partial [Candidatus Paceibacteria bacterium]